MKKMNGYEVKTYTKGGEVAKKNAYKEVKKAEVTLPKKRYEV